jgi:CBS domain containing-hemolysin-like protein
VAGLVLATLHRIPLVGEVFRVGPYSFTVLEADKRRVLTVRVIPTPIKKPTLDEAEL